MKNNRQIFYAWDKNDSQMSQQDTKLPIFDQ
jgi:hypothetical protein